MLALIFSALVVAPTNQLQAPKPDFQQQARQAAAKQGWPGYPESYQDAFVAGAMWAKNRKALICE